MSAKPMKTYSHAELEDKFIGKIGTPKRDNYEMELSMDLLGDAISTARKERGLTQEQLGLLIGVQKAQVSKLERTVKNATIQTILKVFNALNMKVGVRINPKEKPRHKQGLTKQSPALRTIA